MPDPATLEDYNHLQHQNYSTSGFGFGNIQIKTPCPFCAQPGFHEYELLQCQEVLAKETVCSYCKRGMKAIFKEDSNSIEFELVQTQGDDPPAYLPKMRRVDNAA